MDIETLRDDLRSRIRVLSRGLLPPRLDGRPLSKLVTPGVGAGPQGVTFHIISPEDQKPRGMISAPIYPEDHHLASYALRTELGTIPGTIVTEDGMVLKGKTVPNVLQMKLRDGTPLFETNVGVKHCYNTLASVMGFGCRHFDNNQPCKFCETSSVGRDVMGGPAKQDFDRFAEAVEVIDAHDEIRSITITSGTFSDPDDVVRHYIDLVRKIKRTSDRTVHVQFEPVSDLSLFQELSALVDSVGIFLEIFNEEKRKEVCPGKARIGKEQYLRNWEAAVEHLGRGNVATTCLLGFGVDDEEILQNVDRFAEIGVRTSLLFVRCKSKQLAGYVPTYLKREESELIELHIAVAKHLVKHGIGYRIGGASGCVGCQGCTAMNEACRLSELTALENVIIGSGQGVASFSATGDAER